MIRAGNCIHDADLSRECGVILSLIKGSVYVSVLYGGNRFTRH